MRCGRENRGRGVRSLPLGRSDFYVRRSSRNCKWVIEDRSLAFRGSSLCELSFLVFCISINALLIHEDNESFAIDVVNSSSLYLVLIFRKVKFPHN